MTEIFIENNRADIDGSISALLTFALDDVADFGSRNTTWSKTIIMPGTARNNRIFGHVFDVRGANEYDPDSPNIAYNFNPAKKAAVLLFVDQVQTFKGWLRLLEIRIDGGYIEYEVAVFGELYGLIQGIGRKKLQDLDFSAYDHTFNLANITASWDDFNAGSGYYYPLIDYGQSYGIQPGSAVQKHNWQYQTFRPAFFVREYLDKIITGAGYTYEAPLFDTERFKRLIVPHNQKNLTKITSEILNAVLNNGTIYFTNASSFVEFGSFTGGNFSASFTNSQFTYTQPDALNVTVTFEIRAVNNGNPLIIELRKNATTIDSVSIASGNTELIQTLTWTGGMVQNDYFRIRIGNDGGPDVDLQQVQATLTVAVDPPVPSIVLLGDSLTVNSTIPRNVLQRDFFVSIIKMFNLYVYDDPYKANHVVIKPYVDFYSTDIAEALDWTHKVDRSKPIRIVPMSELNSRFYNFKMKEDSDHYNALYKKRYSEGYGDRVFDSEFDFEDSTNTLEVIFSGTPLVGYQGEDKVYSTIMKITNDIEETIDSNIRILQALKVTGVTSWDILDVDQVLGSYTDYPYAGHLNDPDVPSNDIQFGAPKELFFAVATGDLSANMFNVYYSTYMAEITDKNSKLLRCWVKLDTVDILRLDFSKLIWIDGALWRLNKITDFNMSRPEVALCELLKVIETSYDFDVAQEPEVSLNCPIVELTSNDTSVSFSFDDPGEGAEQWDWQLYAGPVLIGSGSDAAPYTNPITGTFTGLDSGTAYSFYLIGTLGDYTKICGPYNISTTGTGGGGGPTAYSYSVGIGNSQGAACTDAQDSPITVYSASSTWTVGMGIYTDSGLTTLLTGSTFIVEVGAGKEIYNLSSGILGNSTGNTC